MRAFWDNHIELIVVRNTMKIMQVIPAFYLAGAERMCATLSCELKKMGIDIVVVSLYNYHSSITQSLEENNIRIIYLDKKLGYDISMFSKIYTILKQEKPDVIHTHVYVTPYVIPSAVFAGVKKRVHTVHNIASKEARPSLQKMNKFFYKFNHMVPVALSGEIQKTIQERYKLPLDKIPIIYNGADLDCCLVKDQYSQNSRLRYIHVGRFSEQKNHIMLIDAFYNLHKQVPDTELLLVGEGDLQNQVRERVNELNLQDCVIFYGKSDNVFPLLHSADVFVLPSNYEGVPISLIEAMGTGLPIVATRVGGIPDMMDSEVEGILTAVNVDDITAAMIRMKDEAVRKRMGEAARKKAEAMFSSTKMAEEYCKLYSFI